jgi:hypothetical protein
MTPPTLLVATWSDGLSVVTGQDVEHELAGQSVRGLTDDGRGGALAIVDGHALARRASAGDWTQRPTAVPPENLERTQKRGFAAARATLLDRVG